MRRRLCYASMSDATDVDYLYVRAEWLERGEKQKEVALCQTYQGQPLDLVY
jgi:hypothetical protein